VRHRPAMANTERRHAVHGMSARCRFHTTRTRRHGISKKSTPAQPVRIVCIIEFPIPIAPRARTTARRGRGSAAPPMRSRRMSHVTSIAVPVVEGVSVWFKARGSNSSARGASTRCTSARASVAALKKSATATGVGAICAIQRATRLQRRRTTQQALLIIYRRIGLQLVEAAAIVFVAGLVF